MYNHGKYILIVRYMFLILPILGTIFKISSTSFSSFILVSLLIVINSQLRIVYLKDKFAAASIIVETLLVFFLHYEFKGFMSLILFSDMIDSCIILKAEKYPLSLFLGISFAYSLYKVFPLEWIIILFGFYGVIFLFLLELGKELEIRKDTESLYDEIRSYAYELETVRSRLLDYSKQVENITQLEERNRISRELHDSIGHSLTGILMQVDACIQIMDIDKERGMKLLNAIYNNINISIETLRQTVKGLRPSEFRTNLENLKNLIYKFKEDTGVNVEFKISGISYEILPSIDTVIYKNVQELMTNALKHGHAKNIFINLLYAQNAIKLTVSNDGESSKVIKKGFGLSGIEERLSLIGGSISYDVENGFTVYMYIPRRGDLNAS